MKTLTVVCGFGDCSTLSLCNQKVTLECEGDTFIATCYNASNFIRLYQHIGPGRVVDFEGTSLLKLRIFMEEIYVNIPKFFRYK